MPQLKVTTCFQYAKYCEMRLVCGCPNSTSMACTAAGLSRPAKRSIRPWAGLPGMSRGRMKFSVIAAHAVTA